MYEQRPSDQIIAGNLVTDVSDHFASVLMLNKITAEKQLLPKIRFFSERNRANFKESLRRIDWNKLQRCQDSNTCAEIFSGKTSRCFNNCFPLKNLPKNELKINHGFPEGCESAYVRKTNYTNFHSLGKTKLLLKSTRSTKMF